MTTYNFSLDVKSRVSQSTLTVRQYDTDRQLVIELNEDRDAYTIDNGSTAVFVSNKPDGSTIFNACIIENNKIIYNFTPQTAAAEGVCACEIRLYSSDGKIITSPKFSINVQPRVTDETVETLSATERTELDEIAQNETQRIANEREREIAEAERASAEIGRVYSVSTAITNARTATLRAENAAEEAEKLSDILVENLEDGGYIPTISDNGNWIVGGIDSGKPSRGPHGDSLYVFVIDYAAPNTGEDVSNAIQRAIDENPNKVICFSDGVYNISKPIVLPADPRRSVSLELSNYAVIKAMSTWQNEIMENDSKVNYAMIRVGGKYYANNTDTNGSQYYIKGGIIDGNHIAGTGIAVESGRNTQIRTTQIKNCKVGLYIASPPDGFFVGSLNVDVEGVNIYGNEMLNSVGVICRGHDNSFSRMRIEGVMKGFEIGSNGNFLNEITTLYTCINIPKGNANGIASSTNGECLFRNSLNSGKMIGGTVSNIATSGNIYNKTPPIDIPQIPPRDTGSIWDRFLIDNSSETVEGTPIRTEAELRAMVAGGKYYLANDITCTDVYTSTLETQYNKCIDFGKGPLYSTVLDGRGYTINWGESISHNNIAPMFQHGGMTLKNIHFNLNVTTYFVRAGYDGTGALIRYIQWTNPTETIIDNCVFDGHHRYVGASYNGGNFGGLVGGFQSGDTNVGNKLEFRNIINNMNVSAGGEKAFNAGGFLGIDLGGATEATSSTSYILFDNCHYFGNLTINTVAELTSVGGFAGNLNRNPAYTQIQNCTNSGKITARSQTNAICSGFVGGTNSKFRIESSQNAGRIMAVKEMYEGSIGFHETGGFNNFTNCYSDQFEVAFRSLGNKSVFTNCFVFYYKDQGAQTAFYFDNMNSIISNARCEFNHSENNNYFLKLSWLDGTGSIISPLFDKSKTANADERFSKFLHNEAYPMGAIYMSTVNTSPASLFGGEWERIKDRFLLSAGDMYAQGAIGGSATHTLTVAQMPFHTHNIAEANNTSFVHTDFRAGQEEGVLATRLNKVGQGLVHETDDLYRLKAAGIGGSEAHNNMPPYFAVYMWKRVA